ncbi:FHA domain protein [Aquisphaera giovannonii]|uniref:FHA domain protein n=1 Tax=Aquisphaera giovannonii TaxID=406548 RepID=A0A5B9WBP8_9BACT|nr:FHA domain-containing protein [Aquisphaera giovannonii]QEH37937.1 FHA domain protein [Aquisphaera giovannonii]
MPAPAGTANEMWILEIVRGREPGRTYSLAAGETILGNALGGMPGLDLSGQEPTSSPRRMAARQASVTLSGGGPSIRDLDSPGGTFVNRQRLFSAQARPLQPGDLIQLGGVQLEVKRVAAPAPPPPRQPAPERPRSAPSPAPAPLPQPRAASPSPGPPVGGGLPAPYTLGGATCRAWDDFLPLAAQRWRALRDELTSGRLADFLRRIGRPDLLPSATATGDPDERLDAWLAGLPVTRPSGPELDVHPATIVIRTSVVGTVRQTLRITNVGFRLLRSQVSVEAPPATRPGASQPRIRVSPGFASTPFATIDETDVPIEVDLPDEPSRGASGEALGAVVVRSNGGVRRVEVRAERPPRAEAIPEPFDAAASSPPSTHAAAAMTWARPVGKRVASQSLGRRVLAAAIALMLFRALVMASGLLPTLLGSTSPLGHWAELRLAGMAMVLAAAGALLGAAWILRGSPGEPSAAGDLIPAAFAGALLGVFAAAIGYAVIQSVEAPLGPLSSTSVAVVSLWGVVGAGLGLLSWIAIPPDRPASSPAPEAPR